MIYTLCARGSGCLTLKLSRVAAVGHQETFHFHVSSRVCLLSPFFSPSVPVLSVFIRCHDPLHDRQLPDYDQHREPITRPPVFISIIHREVSPVSIHATFASRRFFLKLAAHQTAAATRPHLELIPRIYITRGIART